MAQHKGLGWQRDLPDSRDRVFGTPATIDTTNLPASINLTAQCPAVYDQGQLGSCHDDKTEILTDRGFKLFADLDGSERLATVSPETCELFFEVPTRVVRFPYRGQMHCISNQSLNFKVTPEHKMLVRNWNEKERTLSKNYEFVAAKDIGWYSGLMNRVQWKGEIQSDIFTLPGVEHKHTEQRTPKDIPLKSWVRFLGIYLAEGTMLKRDQRQGTVSHKIQIVASKEQEKEFVRTTLAEIGVSALELTDRFTFADRRIYEAMTSLGLENVKAGNKFVPAFIFHLGADMIGEFLAGHFAGDGSMQYNIRAHHTSSSKLASDLQALIFLSGNETRMTVREGRSSMTADGQQLISSLPEHRISVCEQKSLSIERAASWFTENYDGEVFCAEVPTFHTLVTRREGKILISGNCTANAIAGAFEFDLLKQGLQDFTPSRLFIYYFERFIEHTVASDAGARLRDGLKVVNQRGVCSELEWPYDIQQFTVEPPAEDIDEALENRVIQFSRINQNITQMKACLAAGSPFVFGITVYTSFESAPLGQIPMPNTSQEQLLGGHALVAVGYDDTTQRFNFRNSWGASWGQAGYGTIPYSYLLDAQLASDFWALQAVSEGVIAMLQRQEARGLRI
jgi:hypothetical protein